MNKIEVHKTKKFVEKVLIEDVPTLMFEIMICKYNNESYYLKVIIFNSFFKYLIVNEKVITRDQFWDKVLYEQ